MAKRKKKQTEQVETVLPEETESPKRSKKKEPVYGQKSLIRSTQAVLPIETIQNGVIVLRGHGSEKRYVKILEIKPNAFSLKSEEDKVSILNSFQALFINGPDRFQLSAYSFPSAHTKQLDMIDHEWEYDKSHREEMIGLSKQDASQLDDLYGQYRHLVDSSQSNSVNKRFFLSFEYDGGDSFLSSKNKTFEEIAEDMNDQAKELKIWLENCDNFVYDVVGDRADWDLAEILYSCLNRDKIISDPFEENHAPNIVYKHMFKYGRNWNDIPATDFFAPECISFGDDPDYTKVNDTYYRFMYLDKDTGYPTDVQGGWLMNLFDIGTSGVDVHVFFRKENKEQALRAIRNSATRARAELSTTSDLSQGFATSSKTHAAGMYLLSGLDQDGVEELFSVGVEVAISDTNKDRLNAKYEAIMKAARNRSVRLRNCRYENYPAFCSSLPLAVMDDTIWKKTKRNILGQDAVSFYVYTTSEFNDPNGIYFGRDRNQANVIVDLFNPKIKSHNTFLCGSTGSGKTFTLVMMAIRLRLMHIPIIMIVPEKESELKRCTKAMGGQFIQIGEGTTSRINLLGIIPSDPRAEELQRLIDGDDFARTSDRVERIKQVKEFFRLKMGDQMRVDEPALIDRAVKELYDEFGIHDDYESLFINNDPKTQELKPMPTFGDLYEKFKQMCEAGSPCETLMNVTYEFAYGSGSSFNGQTNVQLDNPFTVIGLEHINDEAMAPLGIFLAMDLAWSKVKENKTQKIVLFIDEWWSFAKNGVGAAYSDRISRTIRSYSGAMILASQQLSDTLDSASAASGKSVLNNCKTKIIMGTEKKDLENVRQLLDLTDAEASQISGFQPGEALLFMGNTSTKLRFVPTKIENDLAATDRETLLKIAERKQKEKEEAEKAGITVNATNDVYDEFDDDEIIMDFTANQNSTNPSAVNNVTQNIQAQPQTPLRNNANMYAVDEDDDDIVEIPMEAAGSQPYTNASTQLNQPRNAAQQEAVSLDDDDDIIVVPQQAVQSIPQQQPSAFAVEDDDDDDCIVI